MCAPREMDRVSGARLVCPCIVDQDGVLEDASSTSSRAGRPRGKPSKVKQGVEPDNCQDSENLGLMVGESAFWHQIRRREGASACYPNLRYLALELSSILLPTNPGPLWFHIWVLLFLYRFPSATTWWPWHDPGDGHMMT